MKNIARISIAVIVAGALTGCATSGTATPRKSAAKSAAKADPAEDLADPAESAADPAGSTADPAGSTTTPEPTRSPRASVFAPPFPKSIGVLNFDYTKPPEKQFVLPSGPHHTFLGEQVTVAYRNDEALLAVTAIGGQARVSDAEAAVDWLTENGRTDGRDREWTEIDPGPLGGAAACVTTDGATWCYWADADTVAQLVTPSLNTEGVRKNFVTIRNALEKEK
ncbi:hypothetical protein GCM10010517_46170 [Streptosporangium fragile]|uniref:Uncharacterized protein n=1 Tax=Streptosporangium fragile TaxID=46186 RepID=A0ABN3W0S6_9ACTN